MEKEDLYYIYDTVWFGKHQDFKSYYMDTAKRMSPPEILEICRYAFSYYLRWSPATVRNQLSVSVLRKMRLYNLVMNIYPFPLDMDEDMRIRYLIGQMYPQYYDYDEKNNTEEVYRKLNEGELAVPPKGFFSDTDEGKNRIRICFRYMLNHYHMSEDYEEIFSFFESVNGRKFLKKHFLKQPMRYFGTASDLIYRSFEDLGLEDEDKERCTMLREKYKSKAFMERRLRDIKKMRYQERKAQEEAENSPDNKTTKEGD